jgi:hypothetical protein
MTHYVPDYKYEKAKEVVDGLSNNDERDGLIKYYIKKHEEWHEEDRKRLKEYQDVFEKFDSLLSGRRGPTVYGG